jgi:cytochrome c oxidase cbb3-type subunit 4
MDLNDLRSLWTVLSFAAFLGIVFWAYSGARKARFEEAAQLALDDDLAAQEHGQRQGRRR